jgi:hypothetical protein
MRHFAEELQRSPPGRDAHETLRNMARTFVGVAVQDPLRYELLFLRPVPGFVPSPESLSLGLTSLARTRQLAEEAGLRTEGAFDLFMATTRGLVAMQIANQPGGDRWARLVDEAVDILVAHYAPPGRNRPGGGRRP